MTKLRVYTARYSYRGPDRFDITRKGADDHQKKHGAPAEGEPFAPSWSILTPAKALLDHVDPHVRDESWKLYARAYAAEMKVSHMKHRAAWDALLAREEVTLVCFCDLDKHGCHRTLLAQILVKLGADHLGERSAMKGCRKVTIDGTDMIACGGTPTAKDVEVIQGVLRVQRGDGTMAEAREVAGLTLAQAAKLLGVSVQHLAEVERGESRDDLLTRRCMKIYQVPGFTQGTPHEGRAP